MGKRMCDKRSTVHVLLRGKPVRVDPCIRDLLREMNDNEIQTLGSCCGHGKRSMSVVVRTPDGKIVETVSGVEIPRTRRFYKRDADGFYYIPEAETRL